ncbi:MAG: VanZ family protein [Winogradskyella sp.]
MAILYSVVLVIASLISINDVPKLGFSFDDKIYHFVAYFGLAFLWITYSKTLTNKKHLVFISVLLYAVLLEVLQHKINPNRTYDTYDLLANCVGVIIGTLVASRLNILKLK